MLNEKIITSEIIEDSELDQVAGGNGTETQKDADALRNMGFLSHQEVNKDQVNDAFCNLGLGIGTELHNGDSKNKYYIDHKKVSRDELWSYIHQHHKLTW